MKESKKFVLIVVLLLLVYFIDSIMHEGIHREVYRKYGLNSTTSFYENESIFGITVPIQQVTEASGLENLSAEDVRDVRMVQSQAEVVGYNFESFSMVVVLCTAFIIVCIPGEKEKKEESV